MKVNWDNVVIILVALFFLGTCATQKRIGAICEDGWESTATGSGACSSHGGVEYWKVKYWWGEETTTRATGYFDYLFNLVLLGVVIWQIGQVMGSKKE